MRGNHRLISTLTLVGLVSVGCSKMSVEEYAMNQVNEGKAIKSEDRPSCEVQPAEYALDTKMVAFELTSSAGLHVGFDLLSGFMKLITLDFKAKSGRMSMSMSMFDPLATKYELASALGSARLTDFGASLDLGFKSIGAGFSFYSKTPLATLAERGLRDTLKNLVKQMSVLQHVWHTEVLSIPTSESLIIPTGTFAGLKICDQFSVFNVEHVWSGTPCSSEHLIARKTTAQPIMTGEVTQIANNAAVLTILDSEATPRSPGVKILTGAMVEVHKLVGENRKLFRSLNLRHVIGAELAYEDSKKVDLSPHLKDQLHAVAREFNFMIYLP